MKVTEILTLILGAAGLWKLLEVLIKLPTERFVRKAESRHFHTQSDAQIVENWVKWSEKLEERIKELEAEAGDMRQTIARQNQLIESLELKIDQLVAVNTSLQEKLNAPADHGSDH